MHRRARHLNARDAGATMVLDARFISGSDGDAIGTWSSRTSSTYDVTQATAANKPLLKLGANGINGQATVLFDGTNDRMDGANESVTTCSIFGVVNNTGVNAVRAVTGRSNSTNFARQFLVLSAQTSGTTYLSMSNSDGTNFPEAISTDFTSGNHLFASYNDGSNLGMSVDGKTNNTATSYTGTSVRAWNLGYLNDGPAGPYYFWDSKISSLILFKNSVATSSVTKRINHAMGFSFKIACS